MKKHFFTLTLFTAAIMMNSCSNQDVPDTNDFKGFYKITSISSSVQIDLNNDGIKTNDYLQEIKSGYTNYDGEIIDFGYDNNLSPNFAEARPTNQQSNDAKLLDIRFPFQEIDSLHQGNGTYVKVNMSYRNMNTGFIYKLTNSNVEIESDPFNHCEYYGIDDFQINRLNQDEFETIFNFEVYDFNEDKWILTELKTKYQKLKFN